MAEGRQFGTILNERRLELGYSLGQFANRIGTTAAQVRAWERGDEVPDDATVGRIAGELDLPGAPLRQALKETRRPPAKSAAPDVTGSTPKAPPAASARPKVTGDRRDAQPSSGDGKRAVVDAPTEAVASIPPAPPGRGVPPPPRPTRSAPAALAGPPTGTGVATAKRSAPRIVTDVVSDTPPTGVFAGWDRALRVVFDPDKRYLLWVRTGLTIVVMVVFLIVLSRAVPALFDVIGDILDTIESSDSGLDRIGDPITDGISDLPGGVPTTLPSG